MNPGRDQPGKDNDAPAETPPPGDDRPEPMDRSNRQERTDRGAGSVPGSGSGAGSRNAESKSLPFPREKSQLEKELERWERKLKVRLD